MLTRKPFAKVGETLFSPSTFTECLYLVIFKCLVNIEII